MPRARNLLNVCPCRLLAHCSTAPLLLALTLMPVRLQAAEEMAAERTGQVDTADDWPAAMGKPAAKDTSSSDSDDEDEESKAASCEEGR